MAPPTLNISKEVNSLKAITASLQAQVRELFGRSTRHDKRHIVLAAQLEDLLDATKDQLLARLDALAERISTIERSLN